MKFILTATISAMALIGCATHPKPLCLIENYGLVQHGRLLADEPTSTAASGQIHIMADLYISQKTDTIPAKIGTEFGIQYLLSNIPPNELVETTIAHPPIPNKAGIYSSITRYTAPFEHRGSTYRFDRANEVLPGKWSFSLAYRGELLCTKEFNVQAVE